MKSTYGNAKSSHVNLFISTFKNHTTGPKCCTIQIKNIPISIYTVNTYITLNPKKLPCQTQLKYRTILLT